MAGVTHMTLAEARARIPRRSAAESGTDLPPCLSALPERVRAGRIETIARSPGGRPVHAVSYGAAEPGARRANYNSAIGARDPAAFADTCRRTRPVLLLIGPVHGQETEGLTGLDNLISVLETGRDRAGVPRPDLADLARCCRVVIVPTGNPDGVARFEARSLAGLGHDDLRFWGQGTRADHSLWGWPGCKALHPMRGDVGFLGCYFNDAGVNPMHDEFFAPLSDEAPAILRLAGREAPDLAVSLHSHAAAPVLLRPAYVPRERQERVRDLGIALRDALTAAGLPAGREPGVADESGKPPAPFNLVSALHHVSGTAPMTFECPHGLSDGEACRVSPAEILEIQLCLYAVLLRDLAGRRPGS